MASKIGLPSVIVEFKQKASTAIQRGNTGIVALVLRDTQEQGLYTIKEIGRASCRERVCQLV